MSVKAIIFSYNSLLDARDCPYPGVPELLAGLQGLGIRFAVTSNSLGDQAILMRFNAASLPPPHALATYSTMQVKKPSPLFVHSIVGHLGVGLQEVVYVGDKSKTDAICAINAGVLPLHAYWANRSYEYSIALAHPARLLAFYHSFLVKNAYWQHSLVTQGPGGFPLEVFAMMSADWHKPDVHAVLKHLQLGRQYQGQNFFQFLTYQWVTSLFLSGIAKDVDICTVYPSSKVGKPNSFEESGMMKSVTDLFKSKWMPGLIKRHTDAPKSALARYNRQPVYFHHQPATIYLEQSVCSPKRLKGKTILVLDDFNTEGNAFEAARMYLYAAGAKRVICVAMGRYPKAYNAQSINRPFDPFAANTFAAGDFTVSPMVFSQSGFDQVLDGLLESFAAG